MAYFNFFRHILAGTLSITSANTSLGINLAPKLLINNVLFKDLYPVLKKKGGSGYGFFFIRINKINTCLLLSL